MAVVYLATYPPIILSLTGIANYFGNKLVIYMAIFQLVLNVVFSFIFLALISPWFNKHTKLEDGELRTAIENLAASLNFPLNNLFVIDGSQRSSHSNAYFIGLPWYKQIVLYDTLIKDQTTEQIVAVLAHELGHWKNNHITQLMLLQSITGVPGSMALLAFLNNPHFFDSLGFSPGVTPTILALHLYTDALVPLKTALVFLQNYVSRVFEYEADKFAAKLGKGSDLYSSLISLNKSNLSSVDSGRALFNVSSQPSGIRGQVEEGLECRDQRGSTKICSHRDIIELVIWQQNQPKRKYMLLFI